MSDLEVPQAWIDELDEVSLVRRQAFVQQGARARARLEQLLARAQKHADTAARLKERALNLFDEAIEHETAAMRIADAMLGAYAAWFER